MVCLGLSRAWFLEDSRSPIFPQSTLGRNPVPRPARSASHPSALVAAPDGGMQARLLGSSEVYVSRPLTRARHTGMTKAAGLLVSDITGPPSFNLIRGAGRGTESEGYIRSLPSRRSPAKCPAPSGPLTGSFCGFPVDSDIPMDHLHEPDYRSIVLLLDWPSQTRSVPPHPWRVATGTASYPVAGA